jgi:hypothetical protein
VLITFLTNAFGTLSVLTFSDQEKKLFGAD